MSPGDETGRGDGGPLQRAEWIDGKASGGEARIGDSRLVKGGARVSSSMEEAPAAEAVPPGRGRVLSEAEIAESGLLRERVIEIGETREEAIVSKQAVVREELVVRRDVEERTERVAETLRRTEVDVERLEPKDSVESEGAGDAPGR
jgi:stress response protein YsnF